ncbi:trans-1,2-dihydrobenzene-1,2-diol dehydrogenase-like [Oculina patagonica]
MAASATRWGICGAGQIAHDFMVAMKTLPENDHKVVAVSARSLERAAEFANRHNIEKAYGSYEELANDKNVEVVYVSTIAPVHASLCKLALNHGKHVLCETPMTMNLKDTKELFELAKAKGLFIMEALWTRFLPLYADVKNLVDSNALGEIRVAMVSCGINCDSVERLQDPNQGGSALLNLGIYCLHVMDMIFGGEEPLSISAAGQKTPAGADSTLTVTMLYKGNKTASSIISIAANLPNDATVVGSQGSLTIHAPFHGPTRYTTPAGTKEYPLPQPSMPMNFENSTGMRYEIQAVRQSLLSGELENSAMPWKTTEKIFRWMDEIRHWLIGVVFKGDM